MSDPGLAWRETLRSRVIVAAALLGLWAVGIEARLVTLQIYQHADLQARAVRQQQQKATAPAKRGDIVEVAEGHARNFLLPKGHAIPASDGAVAQATAMRRARDLRDAADREAAQTIASALVAKTITIKTVTAASANTAVATTGMNIHIHVLVRMAA